MPEEPLPFTLKAFSEWFAQRSESHLEPARASATSTLEQVLDRELSEPLRTRVRVANGRIKGRLRTYQKITAKYPDQVESLEDVPRVVNDLVGLRIVCTNKSDLDQVVETINRLPEFGSHDGRPLSIDSTRNKDYIDAPKESGYRAVHKCLVVAVSIANEPEYVKCELQIRTLLQDSWGELTHEDTYKPGGSVPQIIDTISRRMADMMATLDDMAQDLRDQLEREADIALEPGDDEDRETPDQPADDDPATRQAAVLFLRERVEALSDPIDFASLAWELQREFGVGITRHWFGYSSFKSLLLSSVPDAPRSSVGPGYLLPEGSDVSEFEEGLVRSSRVPPYIETLHACDRSFPLVSSDTWPQLFIALSEGMEVVDWRDDIDVRAVNSFTRAARDDTSTGRTLRLSRSDLNYVAFGLFKRDRLTPKMDPSQIEANFVEMIDDLCSDVSLSSVDRQSVECWIRGNMADGSTKIMA